MNWCVEVADSVEKYLRRIPRKDYRRIEAAIDSLETDPFTGDLTKLGGFENVWRRRVGNYRIKFQTTSKTRFLFVFEIKRRTSTTY